MLQYLPKLCPFTHIIPFPHFRISKFVIIGSKLDHYASYNSFTVFDLGAPEFILIMFALIPIVLIVFCLLDIIKSKFSDETTKLIWVLIVILKPILGSILYLLLGKKQQVN
ncbi:PLD nuclease N-terminal domain-containing protein [Arcticibacter svalbardensis]|uniref:PLD nuclease N-terminal domain-containing protein n=1 Tax=Arcticibacter svalbardensis TaxID=1288027 RepID=UPI000A07AF06